MQTIWIKWTWIAAFLTCVSPIARAYQKDTPRLAPALSEQQQLEQKAPGAEVLYSLSSAELDESGHWQRRIYVSIRMNDNAAARDYGRISIPFNHYYSELSLEFANTLSPEGNITHLAHDATQQRVTGGGQDFYSDSSELVFSLPGIETGSILEFQYLRKSKNLTVPGLFAERVVPHWFQRTAGGDSWRADFVHHHEYRVRYPASIKLKVNRYSGYPQSRVADEGDFRVQIWRSADIKALVSEGWSPKIRDLIPSMSFSSLRDWRDINRWTWQRLGSKLELTEDVQTALEALALPSTASNEEKLRAVYAYLQKNIRYVFAHLGRGGYEPHAPDEVLRSKYGDCKDQTTLAITLLNALGIKALPALVETPSSGESETDIVNLIFDHMLVYLPPGQDLSTEWMDTTGEQSLYPGVSHYLAGQNALIIDAKSNALTKMPEPNANAVEVVIDYYAAQDGKTRAHVTVKPSGIYEQNLRNWWLHNSDKKNALNQYLSPLFGGAAFVSGRVENDEALWKGIELHAEFGLAQDDPAMPVYGASVTQLLRVFSNINALPLPESRQNRFRDKYAYSLNLSVTAHGLENQIPALVQSVDQSRFQFFALESSTTNLDRDYRIDIRFHKPGLDLDTAQYQGYYSELMSLGTNSTWLVRMVPEETLVASTALPLNATHNGAPSATDFIVRARHQIENGLFEDAVESAQQAVHMQKANGEAWYVLALAQGFSSLIDDASQSFARAEELGYLP